MLLGFCRELELSKQAPKQMIIGFVTILVLNLDMGNHKNWHLYIIIPSNFYRVLFHFYQKFVIINLQTNDYFHNYITFTIHKKLPYILFDNYICSVVFYNELKYSLNDSTSILIRVLLKHVFSIFIIQRKLIFWICKYTLYCK